MKFSILIILLMLSGCANVKNLHDERFSTGCTVVDASLKTGIINSQGELEACKLVCSENLPEGFYYKYENRGCSVGVGKNGN